MQTDYARYLAESSRNSPSAHASRPHDGATGIDWDEFDLGRGAEHAEQGHVDPELQALLDTILQPHLNVGIYGYDAGFAIP
jgi:hypothetical protein